MGVITPAFNAERTLPALAASLERQGLTPTQLHWIVVDDGSLDGTLGWATAFASRAPFRMSVVAGGDNQGEGPARNKGGSKCDTAWLTYVDADDSLEPGALLAWLGAAQRLDLDLLMAPSPRGASGRATSRLGKVQRQLAAEEWWYADILRDWGVCSKLYRTGFLTENGLSFPSLPEGADADHFIHALLAKPRLGVGPGLPRYVYENRGTSGMHHPTPQSFTILGGLHGLVLLLKHHQPTRKAFLFAAAPVMGGVAGVTLRAAAFIPAGSSVAPLQASFLSFKRAWGVSVGDLFRLNPRDVPVIFVACVFSRLPGPIAGAWARLYRWSRSTRAGRHHS